MTHDLAIIGSGDVGRTLAASWADTGLAVVIGTRRPDSDELQSWASSRGVAVRAAADAVATAEVGVLAVAWAGVDATLATIAGPLGSGVLVDVTNPLGTVDGRLRLVRAGDDSGGEHVQRTVPRARVVKTLHTVGLEQFDRRDRDRFVPAAMPIATDDDRAAAVAERLVAALGWQPLVVGGLRAARLTEPMAQLWIEHARRTGDRTHLLTITSGVTQTS